MGLTNEERFELCRREDVLEQSLVGEDIDMCYIAREKVVLKNFEFQRDYDYDSSFKIMGKLFWDFAHGMSGNRHTYFDPNHPFSENLKNTNMMKIIVGIFYLGLLNYQSGKREDIPKKYVFEFSIFNGDDSGILNEILKDGRFSPAQFIGSCTCDFMYYEKKQTLKVHIYDTKNLWSFLFHFPPAKLIPEERDKFPYLSTTFQEYDLIFTLDEIKKIYKYETDPDRVTQILRTYDTQNFRYNITPSMLLQPFF